MSDTAKYTSSSNANHCPVMQRSSPLMPLFQRMVLPGMPLETFFFLTERSVSHRPDILICLCLSEMTSALSLLLWETERWQGRNRPSSVQFKEGFRVCPISQLEETAMLWGLHWHLKTLWAFSSTSRWLDGVAHEVQGQIRTRYMTLVPISQWTYCDGHQLSPGKEIFLLSAHPPNAS